MRQRFWAETIGWTLVRSAILGVVVFSAFSWFVSVWVALGAGVVAAALTFADQTRHRGR